ncbi:tripartite tricarboxylate transporter permease [Stella sp.]|uniref:tripartite tricarboxylate transporter permease n=1 Tax=Stella sp. TaxID=2912054 RepID=UPI0035ADCF7C
MLETIAGALVGLLSGWHLAWMMAGVLVGLVIGILPGLGGIAGMAILLPFIYGMDPVSALGMLIGMVAVVPTGDTFTSILMGIPGSSASQATILDGFPMAKRGEAARALSAAFLSSMIGGVIGALVLTVFVVVARPVILAFSSAELFMLTVLGLSMVGVLSGSSLLKGLLSCALGLLLGSIGAAPATGEWRFTFGLDYLTDGLPIVVVGLGIFALPEIIDLLRANRAIAAAAALGRGWRDGVRDTLANMGLVLRCSGIGCLIGALPGLGGSVVDWVAYGHVVQTSRDRSQFGRGDVRGVIAPESANNAVQGGALIPTLLFGIPGSGSMAIFLGGMVLLGLQPGITMIETRLDLTYTIIWSLAIANILGAGLCVLVSRHVARLTTIPYVYLAPFMVMIVLFAAYQATRDWGDILALMALGVLGVYMRRFGWPRPPLLIGFVLAPGAETYLYQAIQFHAWAWLWRPGVIVIAVTILLSVWAGMRVAGKGIDEGGAAAAGGHRRLPQAVFALVLAAVFAHALWQSLGWSYLAQVFPLGVAAPAMAGILVVLGLVAFARHHAVVFDTEHLIRTQPRTMEYFLAWLAGLLLASAVLGFLLGLALYFAAFLAIEARAPLRRVVTLTASAIAFLVGMAWLFVLDFPRGLLQEAFRLPWPLA